MPRLFSLLLLAAFAHPVVADEPPKVPAPAAKSFSVTSVKDIAYRTDADADPVKHKLDLYLPEGVKDFPVLVFVHGGTWRTGNKERYRPVGEVFARNGIGTAVINYRLSPAVQHPAHVEDVAKAFAWVHAHVADYGGRADRVFLCGHSAGGHLVALLATDDKYLKAEKLSFADIHGVIGMSGVYVITPIGPLEAAFGSDPAACIDASPLSHVHGGHPPFLMLYADGDIQFLDRMAEQMGDALKKSGCEETVTKMTGRNHITIISKMREPDDPTTRAVLAFVGKLTP